MDFFFFFKHSFCAIKVLILSTDSGRWAIGTRLLQEVGSVWVLTFPSSHTSRPLPNEYTFCLFWFLPCLPFLGPV